MDHYIKWMLSCIPQALLLYWILAAGSVLVTVLPVPAPDAFKAAVTLSASRGKLWQGRPAALGPLQDWSVPQVWFLHFYVVGAAVNLLLLGHAAAHICSSGPVSQEEGVVLTALLLFEVHLVRRALETAFLMKYPPGAKMHGIAYLFGLSYYIAVPLTLIPASWIHELSSDWRVQLLPTPGKVAEAAATCVPKALQQLDVRPILGGVVLCAGQVMQLWSHARLAALSQQGKRKSQGTVYHLPTGGLFELVSCPHYMAEVVIYCGLLLLLPQQPAVWLILLWVLVNLALAAQATHQWYQRTFRNYPRGRRALIPWLF